ncbi:hypothetical protein CsSME_00030368 [Camellia sinensis var. sinensis]
MTEHNKAMASAKSDEAKASVKAQKQNTTTGLQTCNNILAMTQLHAKSPSFIGDKRINLSWKEVAKASAPYRCWVNMEKCFKAMDLPYLLATGPYICGRNAIDIKGLSHFFAF